MRELINIKNMKMAVLAVSALVFASAGRMATAGSDDGYLTIKGSDTMVHLVSSWAEEFMKTNPNTDVSVTGGGSGTGIAALLNGTTDICMSSRDIKAREIALAEKKNIRPEEFVVARDGLAVIVNSANPVHRLTMEQIGKIYTGAYTNWKQVGGPDADIIVLSRESSSGTYVFFQEHVLNKQDYSVKVLLMPATSSIVQAVSTDKWAIGYVGLGYAAEAGDKVKMLAVANDTNSPYTMPSDKTVTSGEYSIARPLHLYTNGKPSGIIQNFVEFCLSKIGQQIVRETGYVAISE